MIELIRERLGRYTISSQLEEEHAIKEILQDIALYGLWRTGFFDVAAFQGGTSLRILHGMERFSEDLDFILKSPDPNFSWYVKHGVQPNLPHLQAALLQWGPWRSRNISINLEWLKQKLAEKIKTIDWQEAAVDVSPFLKQQEQLSLQLWSTPFFLHKLEKLSTK